MMNTALQMYWRSRILQCYYCGRPLLLQLLLLLLLIKDVLLLMIFLKRLLIDQLGHIVVFAHRQGPQDREAEPE
jgi:hypothetical protein